MRGLWLGVLVFRWAAFGWMTIAALVRLNEFALEGLAVAALLLTGSWNLWFSVTAGWRRRVDLLVDLAIAVALLPISGLVMAEGMVTEGLFFASQYPASVALTFGAATGVVGGLLAGLALSVGLVWSRVTNGIPLGDIDGAQWGELVNGAVYFLAAAGAAGVVRRALLISAAERARALAEASRQRDRAVRLAERDALGRQIHDSVLQALALVGKRGKELVARPVGSAGRRPRARRARGPAGEDAPGPPERASRRAPRRDGLGESRLGAVAASVHGVPVTDRCPNHAPRMTSTTRTAHREIRANVRPGWGAFRLFGRPSTRHDRDMGNLNDDRGRGPRRASTMCRLLDHVAASIPVSSAAEILAVSRRARCGRSVGDAVGHRARGTDGHPRAWPKGGDDDE